MSGKRGDPFLPPDDFADRPLAQVAKPFSGDFWRISHKDAPSIDWSKSDEARFSHPSHKYSGLYIAEKKPTCFAERFGQDILRQREGFRSIAGKLLVERIWKRISVLDTLPLRVLDLRESDTVDAMGADANVFAAGYDVTQNWARQIMDHDAGVDGLIYTSRLNSPEHSVVLFSTANVQRVLHVTKAPPSPIDDDELLTFLARKKISII